MEKFQKFQSQNTEANRAIDSAMQLIRKLHRSRFYPKYCGIVMENRARLYAI